MNRRSFFRSIATLIVAPTILINQSIRRTQIPILPIKKAAFGEPIYTGFKGANFLETGYVYAPYIPLYQTYNTPTYTKNGFVSKIT